jgi:HAMP domain-containing protein/co-chaperonin GroES (HSP10)
MKNLSLRWKISGLLLITNVIIGIFLIIFINSQVRQNLGSEIISKGKVIAQNLAQFSVEAISEEDKIVLKQFLSNSNNYESVEYILIQKADLSVLADTYNGQVPDILLTQQPPNVDKASDPKVFSLPDDVEVLDIWAPVEEGYLGFVRVGIRQAYVQDKIQKTAIKVVGTIIIAILFIWLIIVYLMSQKVIKPLMYLTNRADEISRGELDQPVQINTGDEIEELGNALERLRESVRIALDRLKKHRTMRM